MAEAYKGLGKLYLIRDEYELAMKNLTKALDLDDNDISVLNSLGMAYVKVHRYRDGVEKYQTALKIKPNDHRIFQLRLCQREIGRHRKGRNFITSKQYFTNPTLIKLHEDLKTL